MEFKVVSNETATKSSVGSPTLSGRPDSKRFFRKRQKIYNLLLLFVVIVGLPIISAPSLRQRLSLRTLTLETAFQGKMMPLQAMVGENQEPVPPEFEKPEPLRPSPPKLPPLDRIFTAEMDSQAPAPPDKTYVPPSQAAATGQLPFPAISDQENLEEEAGEPDEEGPKYQQGAVEQEVYDILLQSNPAIAAMVQGSDPSLSFDSWGVTHRGDDTYWVRLIFQNADGQNVDYIWEVRLTTKQVTPLSHNARTIS